MWFIPLKGHDLAVIENRLDFLQEPVFTNPTTGKKVASVCSILVALEYDFRGHWGTLVGALEKHGGESVYGRTELQKRRRRWPMCCMDLERVKERLPKVQPRKARRIIREFHEVYGLVEG